MKINFLGDSITAGGGAGGIEYSYVSVFERITGYEVRRYGAGGTRIAKQRTPSAVAAWDRDFQERVLTMEKDADYVFIFGGTNDYGHGDAPLGKFDVKDAYTFYGALRCLLEYLIETYGKEKLCFILPLHRFDEEGVPCKGNGDEMGATLSEYVNAMRSIIKEYGIDILDLFENGIPKPIVNTGDEYTVDGVHPNDSGYQFIAKKICEYISKNEAEDENH
jgi:lysophospholipase L1-like esterase